MDHYYSVNRYVRKEYGKKLYKLSLSAGCTCPNRDGKIGSKGCVFCSEKGSGDYAQKSGMSIDEQIANAKKLVAKKTDSDQFIAYFQSFTNTYGSIKRLRDLYLEVVKRDDVLVISIATRPDCIDDAVISMLSELMKYKDVWVELGLQTIHEASALYIRRGYPLSVYDEAVKKLLSIGVHVITHVIIGLPNESDEDMLKTIEYVGRSGASGIKLQLLHVLSDTDLCVDYEMGKFECLTMEHYIELVCRGVERLPKDMVIHRLTGDGPKKILVAPAWSANKKMVLNTMNAYMREHNIEQGSLYKSCLTENVSN